MVKPIFVDSNVWVACFHKNDTNHEKAKKLIENLPKDTPLLTSNLVIYEVLTVLSMRAGKERANKFGEWFFPLASGKIIGELFVDEALEYQAWTLFKNIKQKDISFADCASAVIAKEYDLRYILTFDRHFKIFEKEFGLEILK